MLHFLNGDLFEKTNEVEAVINTVNCVGVMGKGIALEFKNRFPENFKVYQEICKKKELTPGKMLTVENTDSSFPKYIINFPTKNHWRNPSKLEYIEDGLFALKEDIKTYSIKSVSMPALGCGNGGLDWKLVKELISNELSSLPEVDFYIYEPNQEKEFNSTDTKNQVNKKAKKLSDERVLLLLLIDHFNNSPYKQLVTFEEVHYLAYLAQTLGAKLNLTFTETENGPFSDAINKILVSLFNDQYIQIDKSESNTNFIKVNKRKFRQKGSSLKNEEVSRTFHRTIEFITAFETKDFLKALTLSLWIYSLENSQEFSQLKNKMNSWISNKNLNLSSATIDKALNRLESFFTTKAENLTLDL